MTILATYFFSSPHDQKRQRDDIIGHKWIKFKPKTIFWPPQIEIGTQSSLRFNFSWYFRAALSLSLSLCTHCSYVYILNVNDDFRAGRSFSPMDRVSIDGTINYTVLYSQIDVSLTLYIIPQNFVKSFHCLVSHSLQTHNFIH